MLVRDPKHRLGSGPDDSKEIKKHAFWNEIDWDKLLNKQIKPPFKPAVESESDVSNFDPNFTNQEPVLDANNGGGAESGSVISNSVQKQFAGFTFNQDSELAKSTPPASLNSKRPGKFGI